jgi:hypothetical protein
MGNKLIKDEHTLTSVVMMIQSKYSLVIALVKRRNVIDLEDITTATGTEIM